MCIQQIINYINENSGLFLVIFTAFYVFFTYLLFVKNKDIHLSNIMPLPMITFKMAEDKFVIENVGNGIATQVKFEDYYIFLTDAKKYYHVKFKEINLLRPEDNLPLVQEDEVLPDFIIANPPKPIKIRFFFKDIIGTSYYGIMQLGKEHVFVSQIIRLNLLKYFAIELGLFLEKIRNKYDLYKMKRS